MSRIESIQALSKTISDTLTVSRKSFQKLPTPLANQLMPQVERDDGNIEAKIRRMNDSAKKAVAGDTVNNVSNMAREAKNVLPLLVDRTMATEDVGKTLMKLARQMSPLDQIRIKEAVRDTTQLNKQTKAQTNQFKKDADALAREASPYAQILPNGIRVLNIHNKQHTCELVFAGTSGAKVKLKLTHVPNSGGHCSSKNLDTPHVLGRLSLTDTVTDGNGKEVVAPPPGSEMDFVLPGDGKEVKVTYNCEYENKIWCGEKRLDIWVDGKQKAPCTIKVWYPGLKKLDVGGTCLVAYQGNTEQSFHPSSVSHYGKPELIRKLREVSDEFIKKFPNTINKCFGTYYNSRKYEGFIKEVDHVIDNYTIEEQRYNYKSKLGLSNMVLNYSNIKPDKYEGMFFQEYEHNIYVNDMSLPWGGDFKTENKAYKKTDHATHKTGEDVDINVRRLKYNVGGTENKAAQKERMILEKILEEVFGENKVLFEGDHWHCTVGSRTWSEPKYRKAFGIDREKVEEY